MAFPHPPNDRHQPNYVGVNIYIYIYTHIHKGRPMHIQTYAYIYTEREICTDMVLPTLGVFIVRGWGPNIKGGDSQGWALGPSRPACLHVHEVLGGEG